MSSGEANIGALKVFGGLWCFAIGFGRWMMIRQLFVLALITGINVTVGSGQW